METALTYAIIMVPCSMDAVDKFWKGRINPVGDGASPDHAIIMATCSMDAFDKF